jgi:hypothetical protein
MNVYLEDNDQQLLQIEHIIQLKRQMLLDKQQKFKHISNQNQFLEQIKEDYANYYGYIIQQKKEQMESLQLLNTYIHDLTVSGKLSKHNINDAQYEQKKILSELKTIKHNLDNMIQDTNSMTYTTPVQNVQIIPTKVCPPGKKINPKTNRCVKIKPVKVCPPGKEINPKTNRCVKIKTQKAQIIEKNII